MQLRAWSRADSILETEHALDMAELVMDYYNDYFTLAFPLPEQGQDDFNLIVCLVFGLFVCFNRLRPFAKVVREGMDE